ncbi:glutamyl-tRNA synthetase-like protein [Sporormia fimetaria CBS 119925]|uniref:Glutamate--tRNA ligase, mitochondrial n=1 Tax=Sporormia fimetaria CBS 119925 TaxID=1340428 RepID=A0A6A6VF34_9PLEO|nr:glutamyl-tRNA synthetase-like protein [Sporormia fimetaria CBS 119925]
MSMFYESSAPAKNAQRWHSSSPARTPKDKKGTPELPSTPARTRFAPSPTGYLHLGSLRTALFNYLLAKRTGGQFLLRIEDTDQKRTVPDAEQRLLDDLRWAGLQWDEGPEVGGPCGPYKQSERSELYREHAEQLLESGHAYRCFCSTQRLNALAEERHKVGLATDYDRTCASIPKDEAEQRAASGEKNVVRLKVPDRYPTYTDLVYGKFKPLKRRSGDAAFEDPILLKSDGLPTYHLANVVDDHHMQITHVIRGLEWMPSTPKHIAMYAAFGWTPPAFAHVGLLVDEKGNKLSKRHSNFDISINGFKEMEIFPETLTNFAALLGWSHMEKSDVMDLETLVQKFTLKFTKGNTIVTDGKLQFLQRKHAAVRVAKGGEGLQEIVDAVLRLLDDPNGPYGNWYHGADTPARYIERILHADGENYTNAHEFIYRHAYLFAPLRKRGFKDVPQRIVEDCKKLAEVGQEDWEKEALKQKVQNLIDAMPEGRAGAKHVYHYLRVALTGKEQGMRIYDIMEILGREETLKRLSLEI